MTVLDRDLVVVHGPDTWTFLQSLVSQDLDDIADGEARLSLLLTPRGKIDAAFRVVRVGDDAWLDVEAGWGARLAEALRRYLIRVKVEIEDRSPGWGQVAVRNAETPSGVGRSVPAPDGADLLGPVGELSRSGVAGLDADEYEVWRIAAGVPKLGVDFDETTIAQEALLDRTSVSFTKGCFLGQELVGRIDARGHVNRFLRAFDQVGEAPSGAEVMVGGNVVGSLTSVAGGRALGYVRREVAMPAQVVLRWDGAEAEARAEALASTE